MCTVSFHPHRSGYLLAMNRDEKLTRARGLPPARVELGHMTALFPSEPDGGTWIGLNERMVSLALINWYSAPQQSSESYLSRGQVIRKGLTASTQDELHNLLSELPLEQIKPFRLISIFPKSRQILEWRWSQLKFEAIEFPWGICAWFSSGFDEPGAQEARAAVFRQHQQASGASDPGRVRQLHRSHAPAAGPYSICMHRADAATVSYTEIQVTGKRGEMRYLEGSPCSSRPALEFREFASSAAILTSPSSQPSSPTSSPPLSQPSSN
jgi:hypothetical protein